MYSHRYNMLSHKSSSFCLAVIAVTMLTWMQNGAKNEKISKTEIKLIFKTSLTLLEMLQSKG